MTEWERERLKSDIESIVSRVVEAHGRVIRREIDASCCRTKTDWDRLHEAQDAYDDIHEKTVGDLVALASRKAR